MTGLGATGQLLSVLPYSHRTQRIRNQQQLS